MEVTLLTEDQIWGDNALQVIEDYGTKTGLSDLAVILGGSLGRIKTTVEGSRSGYICSASPSNGVGVNSIDSYGECISLLPYGRGGAVCPALPSSTTHLICSSATRARKLPNGKTISIVEYGEYPQTIASEKETIDLEKFYNKKSLTKTGKSYTFDSADLGDYDIPLQPYKCDEYFLNGERFIRVMGKPYDSDSPLSNGQEVEEGKAYWVKVEPIKWRKDPSGIWVANQALIAGIQFDRNSLYDGDFSKTDIKKYLDTYFVKEIQSLEQYLINERKAKEAVFAEAKERLMKNKGKYKDRVSGAVIADRIAEGRRKGYINKEVTPEVGKELSADIEPQVLQEIKVHSQRLC